LELIPSFASPSDASRRRRHLPEGVDLFRQLHDVGMSFRHVVGVERIFLPVEELELGPTAATLHVVNELSPIGDDGIGFKLPHHGRS